MITREIVKRNPEAIIDIAKRYGAHDIRIFGSVARDEVSESSDLDLIVRFESGRSLFDHGALIMDLRDLLGVNVDVISEGGMRFRFRRQVMQEAVPL